MSKKKSEPKAPEAPKPQNEYYYDNGTLQSRRVYSKGLGGYRTDTYSTPDELAIENQSTEFIRDLVGKIPSAFNMSPEALDQQVAAYTDPQKRALANSYNQAAGQAGMAANTSGMRNSVGFNNYLANQLEKNKAQGLADIEAGGQQMRYQLPSMALAPFADAFNLYNAALQGQQADTRSDLEPSFQGSQAASNFMLQNYNNLLNQQQLNNQRRSSGGFLGGLFGGF